MSARSQQIGQLEPAFITAGAPADVTHELFLAFFELKRRYVMDDLRPNAVEGGRFSEAAFRLLQWLSAGSFTPIGKTLPSVPKLMTTIEQSGHTSESVRLHIPRTLRLVYDIRNKRDAAHLADGIDPNLQDATLIVANASWVLAEFVRYFLKSNPSDAHVAIEQLVARDLPVIQEFNGYPRLLKDLKTSDHVMVLLYWAGRPVTLNELSGWLVPKMRANLKRTVQGLSGKHLTHLDGQEVHLTHPGARYVVEAGLLQPM